MSGCAQMLAGQRVPRYATITGANASASWAKTVTPSMPAARRRWRLAHDLLVGAHQEKWAVELVLAQTVAGAEVGQGRLPILRDHDPLDQDVGFEGALAGRGTGVRQPVRQDRPTPSGRGRCARARCRP